MHWLSKSHRVLGLVAWVALLMPATAQTTVIVPADLGELSRDAVAIARGRVTAVEGHWLEDRQSIETIVTLDVESYLKGSLGSKVRFRVPGGEFGRFRTVVVGAPVFAVDDQVIVFLGASGPMVPYIVGFNQGVYRIQLAADRTAGPVVTPPAALPAATTTRIVRGDPARRPMPLADFEQRVRALAVSR